MKKTKWIWRVLGILLLLVVMAGIGFAGFQLGRMYAGNPAVGMNFHSPAFGHMPNFQNNPDEFNNHGFGPMMNHRGMFGHGKGFGIPFIRPLFGLLELAVVIGLVWLVFSLIKNSGWRLVNVNSQIAAPAAPSVPIDTNEKKDEA